MAPVTGVEELACTRRAGGQIGGIDSDTAPPRRCARMRSSRTSSGGISPSVSSRMRPGGGGWRRRRSTKAVDRVPLAEDLDGDPAASLRTRPPTPVSRAMR
jgi:hypothetical protein